MNKITIEPHHPFNANNRIAELMIGEGCDYGISVWVRDGKIAVNADPAESSRNDHYLALPGLLGELNLCVVRELRIRVGSKLIIVLVEHGDAFDCQVASSWAARTDEEIRAWMAAAGSNTPVNKHPIYGLANPFVAMRSGKHKTSEPIIQ